MQCCPFSLTTGTNRIEILLMYMYYCNVCASEKARKKIQYVVGQQQSKGLSLCLNTAGGLQGTDAAVQVPALIVTCCSVVVQSNP